MCWWVNVWRGSGGGGGAAQVGAGVKGQEARTQAKSGCDLMITFLWFLSKLKYSPWVSLKQEPPSSPPAPAKKKKKKGRKESGDWHR